MGSLRTYKLALLRVYLNIFIADLSSDLCMFMVTVGFNFDFVLRTPRILNSIKNYFRVSRHAFDLYYVRFNIELCQQYFRADYVLPDRVVCAVAFRIICDE